MADETKIQWVDSTCNPIMGCKGCELFVGPSRILTDIDQKLIELGSGWKKGTAKERYAGLIDTAYRQLEAPGEGHINKVTTTNIHHFKPEFLEEVRNELGEEAGDAAEEAIETNITCYAATLHLNKGFSLKPIMDKDGSTRQRQRSSGYAPTFELLAHYPDRTWEMARERDLLGTYDPEYWGRGKRPARSWIAGLPRLIFVSDMGDAFSSKDDMPFLAENVMPAITSEEGRRHLWLWLTKRPDFMQFFSSKLGGFPDNVCVMTTLTGANTANLKRLEQLRKVPAPCRGLSIEPLWESIPASKLDLEGIDWVIVGGESGSGAYVRPFNVEWARELRDHCRESGVAFFMKQMGRHPVDASRAAIKLKDSHGGNWDEWEAAGLGDLKLREFPEYFRQYRKDEMPKTLRPDRRKAYVQKLDVVQDSKLSPEERQQYRELKGCVNKAARYLLDASLALLEIRDQRLYREDFATFEAYCQSVHDFSRQYASNLIQAGKSYLDLETIVDNKKGDKAVIPRKESHLRELRRLKDPEAEYEVLIELQNGEAEGTLTVGRIHDAVQRRLDQKPTNPRPQSPSARLQSVRELLPQLEHAIETGEDWQSCIHEIRALLGE